MDLPLFYDFSAPHTYGERYSDTDKQNARARCVGLCAHCVHLAPFPKCNKTDNTLCTPDHCHVYTGYFCALQALDDIRCIWTL